MTPPRHRSHHQVEHHSPDVAQVLRYLPVPVNCLGKKYLNMALQTFKPFLFPALTVVVMASLLRSQTSFHLSTPDQDLPAELKISSSWETTLTPRHLEVGTLYRLAMRVNHPWASFQIHGYHLRRIRIGFPFTWTEPGGRPR